MAWKPKPPMWDWRAFLTADEAAIIAQSDIAVRQIEKLRVAYAKGLSTKRQVIVNRAIHRAKYARTQSEKR